MNRLEFENFTITKREIIASISIITILFIIGFFISEKISEYYTDQNEIYNKAIKIDNDKDLFQYGMDTNIGNSFVYGELKAIDTVTYPELSKQYIYIEKIKERYTMHTRTYTVRVGKTTQTRVQTYWTWDEVERESKKAKEISFCNIKFPINKINIPNSEYIDTIKESSNIRYKYYGVKTQFKGTIFTKLNNQTISENSKFYEDFSIEKTVSYLENDYSVVIIIFWSLWIILIGFCVYGFYYIDNEWLE